jgi:dipeptidyl aminopeptidase/acylaminoacyl peptidase
MDLAALARTLSRGKRVVEAYVGCPPIACPARYRRASPADLVDRTDAPLFIANAKSELIPVSQATGMAAKLAKAGVPYSLDFLPGSVHGAAYAEHIWQPTLRFLERWLGPLPVQDLAPPGR